MSEECEACNSMPWEKDHLKDAGSWLTFVEQHHEFEARHLAAERAKVEKLRAALGSLCDDLEGRFVERFIAHNDPYAIKLGERSAEARHALQETR